jgi:serine/threonine protein kinase
VLRFRFEQAPELAVGDTLGPFRLDELLGEGGMGVVFRASHVEGGQVVALKVLRLELADDELYRHRFLHEARAAAEVRHASLVPILESGEHEGRFYLATAHVAGGNAEQRIRERGPLPVDDLVRTIAQVASGLDALHAHDVIHRDVKTSNVLLAEDGSALITDFGLAKGRAYTVLTKPGDVMGSIDYLAPEILRGEPATPASDIYGLACTAYECATGETPFAGASRFQVGLGHLQEEPPDPGPRRDDWSAALSEALLRGLAKDPVRRPHTATAYATGLRAAAALRSG